MSKILFSGIKPTGTPHIGNYLGALKNWINLQNEYERSIYCLVDLHAITIELNPKQLTADSIGLIKDFLALGINPHKSIIFIQSQVPAHTELAWILSTLTPVSELERMTQYKDKAKENKNNINAGLLTYPILMAADILLYKADVIPVGEDQMQHLELARIIARKFNHRYGETFPEPQGIITDSKRIMSLSQPDKKMSKSHGEKNYIAISDTPEMIREKIMRAVTDTGDNHNDEMSAGVKNLFDFLMYLGKNDIHAKMMSEYQQKTIKYAELKVAVADSIIEELAEFQDRRAKISDTEVIEVITQGQKKATELAEKTMQEVRAKVGLL